jgi:protein-S-isoprenylcysteine O-methyltransferase Ste14
MTDQNDLEKTDIEQGDKDRINRLSIIKAVIGIPLFCALFMFLPAGTIKWVRGWVFISIFFSSETMMALYIWKKNPELLIARSRFHKGTKRWDKIILFFLFPALLSIFILAALDDGRFHWSSIPSWVCGFGYILFFIGFGIGGWAGKVNRFAEPTVRIQKERGHKVIDTGPYGIVRHPGYTGGTLMFFGTALALGSLWALVPAFLVFVILLIRTELEDRTLQEELHGYREYTDRVRYKLLPHFW